MYLIQQIMTSGYANVNMKIQQIKLLFLLNLNFQNLKKKMKVKFDLILFNLYLSF